MLTTANVLTNQEIQPIDRLRELIRERSVLRNGPYLLASGGQSDTFFDMKQTLLHPEGLDLVGEIIVDKIRDTPVQAIGGLVIGACPIADAVALKALQYGRTISAFYVRKDRKSTGTQSLIEGPEVRGAHVIVVDDVTTQGGSVLKAIKALRDEWECKIDTVITIVDREVGARKNLKDEGIQLVALFKMSDFMTV